MEEGVECIICHNGEYKETHKTKIFLDKYLIKDFTIYECDECGHGLVPQEEHRRISKKIKKLRNSTFLRILNKIRSRVTLPGGIQVL